jgi:hypothetical protein
LCEKALRELPSKAGEQLVYSFSGFLSLSGVHILHVFNAKLIGHTIFFLNKQKYAH